MSKKRTANGAEAQNSAIESIKLLPYANTSIKCGLMKVADIWKLKTHPLNRRKDDNHVNEFINIIREEGDKDIILSASELVVNEATNTILDGNHRGDAVKTALRNGYIRPDSFIRVIFERYETMAEEVDRIISLNTHSKNWTLNNYIESFVKWEGEKGEFDGPYSKLKDFCIKHVLCYNCDRRTNETRPKYIYGVTIIKGSRCNNELKHCQLDITDEELKNASIVHDELCQIRDRLELDMQGSDIEGMAQEWMLQRNNIDLASLLNSKPSRTVMKMPKGNRSEWRQVFLTIRDEQETGSKKAR